MNRRQMFKAALAGALGGVVGNPSRDQPKKRVELGVELRYDESGHLEGLTVGPGGSVEIEGSGAVTITGQDAEAVSRWDDADCTEDA